MTASENPYIKDGSGPTLRESVFVFMDILGYSHMIREADRTNTDQKLLESLHSALREGRTWLGDKASMAKEFGLPPRYALKAFTDNIVIGWPVTRDAESEFGDAFFNVGAFQLEMALKGFFVRGAMSVGKAYIDEYTVFGSALIEAYDAESTLARDPRIVLTASAVQRVNTHLGYYGRKVGAPQCKDLLCDSDGQWFLNYLDGILWAVPDGPPFYDHLLKHKAEVEKKLEEFKSNPPIWSKYAWVARYHNYFCSRNSEYFEPEHQVDIELFQKRPRSIVDDD